MIICVKSISNFMCISSSVSHELCGHAKGQERNLSTLFGRTRRLRWGKLFWRRHLILHFCKTYIFATFMRKCQVWWVKEWLFVLYQRNISEKWNSWCFHTFEFWSQNMLFEHERGRDSVSKYLDQWSLNSKPYFWLDVYFKARDDLWLLGLLLFHPKNPWRIINFKDQ